MSIIVEDGTGIAGAEVYHDRAFFNEFVSSWGLGDAEDLDDRVYESAARRGTLAFEAIYASRFPGYPLKSGQGLRFPMSGLVDARSYALPPLPVQIKRAAAAIVWQEVKSPMSMMPTVTPGKVKKSVTAGPVSVDYDVTNGGAGYVSGARPILSIVEGILQPIGGAPASSGPARYGSAARG